MSPGGSMFSSRRSRPLDPPSSLTVTTAAPPTAVSIDAGGPAAGSYSADTDFSSSQTSNYGNIAVDTSQVSAQGLTPAPPVQPEKVLVQSGAVFRPELGESLASSNARLVQRMARRIVEMMELGY